MEILVRKAGMTSTDAIKSATLISAKACGQEKEMGSLEPGKLANILFLNADPIADIGAIRQVNFVVKRGVRFLRKDYKPITHEEVRDNL